MDSIDPKSMQEAMRLASSPAGQQLIRHLQQSNNPNLQQAMNSAAAGDYEAAKKSAGLHAWHPGNEKTSGAAGEVTVENMDEKLGAILNNPQMMQQIMAMAQTMSQSQQEPPKQAEPIQSAPQSPEIDLSMLNKLSGFAGQSTISKEQKALLCALGPYLSHDRVQKLEKAMRAEKMARLASAFLGQGGLSFLSGR